jgi:hypothetical protein
LVLAPSYSGTVTFKENENITPSFGNKGLKNNVIYTINKTIQSHFGRNMLICNQSRIQKETA